MSPAEEQWCGWGPAAHAVQDKPEIPGVGEQGGGEPGHDPQLPDTGLGRTQRQMLLRCTAMERQWTQARSILTMCKGKKYSY